MQDLFDNTDMTGLAAAVAGGEVSAGEVVEFSLNRMRERNPAINAIVGERGEQALREVAAGLPKGPLRGIPFVIKDLHMDVAGLPTTNGSRLFGDAVATADSELVARYRRAGLVIIGKTNAPEFGLNASTEPLLFGPTRNPHRLTHSVGGSSGGRRRRSRAASCPPGRRATAVARSEYRPRHVDSWASNPVADGCPRSPRAICWPRRWPLTTR